MEGSPSIEIVADDRERESGAIEALCARDEVSLRVERLTLGDYLIDGTLLVERNTPADLVASIKGGRLFRQACRLAGSPLRAAPVLEGTGAALAHSG